MKKKIYALMAFGFLMGLGTVNAQEKNVGIGTVSPDQSAVLDIQSDSKGLLIPRLSEQQMRTIKSPATGLMVYQTNEKSGFYFYDGKNWKPLTDATEDAKSIALDPFDWTMSGNTVAAGAFLGTINNQPLLFRVNNYRTGFLNSTGQVFFGPGAGNSNTATNNIGLGSFTLFANTTGLGNVGIGHGVMQIAAGGNSGDYNVGIGFNALQSNTGTENVAIGKWALLRNLTGSSNVAIGASSNNKRTSGNFNMGIGMATLLENLSGSDNMAIGADALRLNISGSRNVAVGSASGRNSTGSDNVFIGFSAGRNETTNSKLYIANTSTTMPLIFGDFSAKYVTIGDVTPALRTQGTATGGYNLLVKGGILTEKVKVALAVAGTDWADYVFEPNYKLMPLEEVEKFTIENKHLPNVPSAQEMVTNGLDVSQTSKMFMEKIEELTLYIIELNKEIKSLKSQINK